MKKSTKIILAILIIVAIIIGIMFLIDLNRMKHNKPVIFSTWGRKYVPTTKVNTKLSVVTSLEDEITEDKELLQDNKKSTKTNDKSSQMQESVIEEVPNISNNYLSISLIGVSTIFFILTIIFLIIFTKHQLKRKKKLSKK